MLGKVGVLIAAVTAVLYFPVRSFINDFGILLHIKNIGAERCKLVPETKACEDLVVHQPSGIAFLACTNATTRIKWFPPRNKQDKSPVLRDKLFSYDINSGKLVDLELEGFSEDFVSHGVGIHQLDEKTIVIAAVNHQRKGEAVSLFEHILGTKKAKHLETVYDPLIRTPNDVVPVSRDSFYLTNDHHYGPEDFWKAQAETFGRQPWSNVVYRDGARGGKVRIVADRLSYANGIEVDSTGKVYVNEIGTMGTWVFQRTQEGDLKKKEHIRIGYAVDNIAIDPESGAIYNAGHPQPWKCLAQLNEFQVKSSSRISVTRNNTREDRFYGVKYQTDTVFEDDGNFYPGATIAAPYPKGKKLVVGSLFNDGILVCELSSF